MLLWVPRVGENASSCPVVRPANRRPRVERQGNRTLALGTVESVPGGSANQFIPDFRTVWAHFRFGRELSLAVAPGYGL